MPVKSSSGPGGGGGGQTCPSWAARFALEEHVESTSSHRLRLQRILHRGRRHSRPRPERKNGHRHRRLRRHRPGDDPGPLLCRSPRHRPRPRRREGKSGRRDARDRRVDGADRSVLGRRVRRPFPEERRTARSPDQQRGHHGGSADPRGAQHRVAVRDEPRRPLRADGEAVAGAAEGASAPDRVAVVGRRTAVQPSTSTTGTSSASPTTAGPPTVSRSRRTRCSRSRRTRAA